MPIVVKSNNSTGNVIYASYLIHSDDLNFLFTAPYSPSIAGDLENAEAIEVKDAEGAFHTSITDSARPMSPPVTMGGSFVISEVHLYGWTKDRRFPWTWGSGGWTTPWVTCRSWRRWSRT